jgi:hypothetical protein
MEMRISKEKKDKISEQILAELYSAFPEALFTAQIARNLARDEEFIKSLLKELWQKNLVAAIKKNPRGIAFSKRIKWRISNKAYEAYKQHQ